MRPEDLARADPSPVYVISVAAQLSGLHPQTLRTYDRIGLVSPGRTAGRGRRYSARDLVLLHEITRLSQDEGLNLEGVKRVLALELHVAALQARVVELEDALLDARSQTAEAVDQAHASHRRDLVPVRRAGVVVYRPHRR